MCIQNIYSWEQDLYFFLKIQVFRDMQDSREGKQVITILAGIIMTVLLQYIYSFRSQYLILGFLQYLRHYVCYEWWRSAQQAYLKLSRAELLQQASFQGRKACGGFSRTNQVLVCQVFLLGSSRLTGKFIWQVNSCFA